MRRGRQRHFLQTEGEESAGAGFEVKPTKNQSWSLGTGWAKPSKKASGEEPRDGYVVETSYTFQVTPNLSITPDLQLLIDPANYPEKDSVWIGGLRVILTLQPGRPAAGCSAGLRPGPPDPLLARSS